MPKKLNSVKLVTLVDIRDDYREHLRTYLYLVNLLKGRLVLEERRRK
jgi:hypothetical protein